MPAPPPLDGEFWRGVVHVHGGEDLLAVAEQGGVYVVRWWHDGMQGPSRWHVLVAHAQEIAALRGALKTQRAVAAAERRLRHAYSTYVSAICNKEALFAEVAAAAKALRDLGVEP